VVIEPKARRPVLDVVNTALGKLMPELTVYRTGQAHVAVHTAEIYAVGVHIFALVQIPFG
jgi:hypothetical protein